MPIFGIVLQILSPHRCRVPDAALDSARMSLHWRFRRQLICAFLLLLAIWSPSPSDAQELKFPQIIKIRYEAQDPRIGGHFIIWVEREKIFYGLDSKIYPAAKFVEITHVTPAPGTTTITMITVMGINATLPDYFHLSGNVRFKVSGMVVTSSNVP